MRVLLLGPIEVATDGRAVVLSAAKERSLLATLALAGGAVVSVDALVHALWGEDPPGAARKTLQTYVWNLRQALGADRVITDADGYRLLITPDDVDVHRFRASVRIGDEQLRQGNADGARRTLVAALDLWRGEAFAGVATHTGLAADATRLEQERVAALEARIAAELGCGRHAEVVGELEALVLAHPFRERLWGHLMVALYRSGRQADALAAYERVRCLLRDELGLEPGGELKRIEAAVLRHELADAPPPPAAVRPSPVRYAKTVDGVSIAHQTAGTGPVALLAVPGYIHHLDIWWNAPTDRLVRRLTAIGRLIVLDPRGMGLSDRPDAVHVDDWTVDALAVLDAVEVEQAVVLGVAAGSVTAVRLAAEHPERVRALIIHSGYARQLAAPGYDIGWPRDVIEDYAAHLERGWGSGVALSMAAPSLSSDPDVRAYYARYQQLSASPSAAIRHLRAATEADVRHLLPRIRLPTLVLHAERDVLVPVAQGRYLAEHIDGAEFVALDSDVHLICVSDVLDQVADHIEDFLARVGRG